MDIKTEYENFLSKIKEGGYGELDFIKFVRNYYLPRPRTLVSAKDTDDERLVYDKDYSKFDFNGSKRLSKRKLILNIVTFILSNNLDDISKLNLIAKKNRLTPLTRPLIQKLEDIPFNYRNRYYIDEKFLLNIGDEKYAVYTQFQQGVFDEALKIFSKTYNLEVTQSY